MRIKKPLSSKKLPSSSGFGLYLRHLRWGLPLRATEDNDKNKSLRTTFLNFEQIEWTINLNTNQESNGWLRAWWMSLWRLISFNTAVLCAEMQKTSFSRCCYQHCLEEKSDQRVHTQILTFPLFRKQAAVQNKMSKPFVRHIEMTKYSFDQSHSPASKHCIGSATSELPWVKWGQLENKGSWHQNRPPALHAPCCYASIYQPALLLFRLHTAHSHYSD